VVQFLTADFTRCVVGLHRATSESEMLRLHVMSARKRDRCGARALY